MNGDDDFVLTIKRDEGFRSKVYLDHKGIPTIGYGTRIDELELTREMGEYFLERELAEKERRLIRIPAFLTLSIARRNVIRSMAYQMGVRGVKNFKNMWKAIDGENYIQAANEMRDSRWWRDPKTRKRAERMSNRMETGKW